MVESPDHVHDGLKSGIFTDGPINYVMIGNSVHRICAPPLNEKTYSLIFWTKTDAEDNDPTTDKIVSDKFFNYFMGFHKFQFGGIIYNIEKLDQSFSLESAHTRVEGSVSNTLAT